tara:strand:- start:327 stop:989 length:663 start_codon:yes stop_codon:yes gene_type:complete
MSFILISKLRWGKNNYKALNKKTYFFSKINKNKINKINPKIIFFLHWSKKIPEEIFKNFLCIQFHASDLPKFRGGSPIQNQIIDGIKNTKISAFKVTKNIDSGDICMKKKLSLEGNVNDIFVRLESTAINMINKIIAMKNIRFKKQIGKTTYIKRRSPSDSNMLKFKPSKLHDIYNFIRMVDSKEYPNAFISLNKFKITFNKADYKKGIINGKFKIVKKK